MANMANMANMADVVAKGTFGKALRDTQTERRVLSTMDHPFVVSLRFATDAQLFFPLKPLPDCLARWRSDRYARDMLRAWEHKFAEEVEPRALAASPPRVAAPRWSMLIAAPQVGAGVALVVVDMVGYVNDEPQVAQVSRGGHGTGRVNTRWNTLWNLD